MLADRRQTARAGERAAARNPNDILTYCGSLNQYSSAGASTFAYDANGNLTTATQPPYTSNYVYDVENRLVSASGAQTALLVYDPLGRLFQTSGGAAGITRFLYDDDALIGEYDAGGYMVHRYIHGAEKGADDPLIWYHNAASGWRRALVADQQGSIVAVADMYGNPVAINAYDEYGIPKYGNAGRFGYTGQAWIPELGMFYYKARMYSPTLGRFLQVDPIGYDDQVNLYAYVGDDPVNKTDPTGTEGACTYTADGCGMKTTDPDRINRQVNAGKVMAISAAVTTAYLFVRGGLALARTAAFTWGMNKVRKKLPGWTETPNRKGKGSRFQDPNSQGNRVRVDKGKPDHPLPSQRVNHVVEQRGGRIIDKDGRPIEAPKPSRTPEAHVPLKDWLRR